MTTPRDDIAGLSERLRRQVAGPDGYKIVFSGTLLEAATQLDALQARVKELEAARMGQIDYSVDLQRIIEGLCHGRTIREPQTGARYHYDLAMDYQARATRAEQERDTLSRLMEDTASELGCASDNEAILEAIDRLKQERDEALERLKPLARDFEMNDCDDRADDDAMEVSIKDLRAASDCVRRLASGPDKEKK